QPDRFLLGGKQLRLVELLGRNRRMNRARDPSTGASRPGLRRRARPALGGPSRFEIEDRALADERVLLGLLPRRLGLLEDREHALAAGPGGAQRTTLDERLDRLLVHGAGVDPFAEVPQRGEPALRAGVLDRLHRLVADAL